ncbi:hypothetical protein CK203_036705 [Vitis vinifera]|uniref:Uncharacterized protein n=1 Tax=Vitis vinifera TaxID=29760 RepID=A0A438I0R6_VITVI|nr:hypothetical protein CK203_036705 [Vitis vinifera]
MAEVLDVLKLYSSSASNIVNNVPATKGTLQVQIQETCQTPEGNETSLVVKADKKLGGQQVVKAWGGFVRGSRFKFQCGQKAPK